MKIIIAGDGKVGLTLTQKLSAAGHDLTLIDSNQRVLDSSVERYDVMGVQGSQSALWYDCPWSESENSHHCKNP